ncbi:hypothetical protein G5C60_22915 [Streptomyces sp. HC44]|uniref:Uncharacterized protein n=1 Tax=Streptomyces scabichelini TaxID=2711217 RepID=A0A6G4V8G3_9ACTN|nr:hypothetical protein [Streptomyces scabichelini]NGO10359.1 hypothetical protein [Streptomyces scabichelini]
MNTSGQVTPVPESMLAREIFGPLGGVVEIGAVRATGSWALPDVSVGAFLARRQDEVQRLLNGVRTVCGFSDASMATFEEVGWFRDHEVAAPFLLMWSGAVEGVPERREELEEPLTVRRMCRMGADLQLTYFLQALVTGAIAAGTEAQQGAETVAEVLGIAVALADGTGYSTPAGVFRTWRVAHLPGILRPESSAPESGRAGFRAYARALEELLDA